MNCGRSSSLNHRHPAIDCEHLADYITCTWTAQPKDRRGNLVWTSGALNRNTLGYACISLFVATHYIAGNLRIDQTGVDRIYVNALSYVFQGSRSCQACFDAM